MNHLYILERNETMNEKETKTHIEKVLSITGSMIRMLNLALAAFDENTEVFKRDIIPIIFESEHEFFKRMIRFHMSEPNVTSRLVHDDLMKLKSLAKEVHLLYAYLK